MLVCHRLLNYAVQHVALRFLGYDKSSADARMQQLPTRCVLLQPFSSSRRFSTFSQPGFSIFSSERCYNPLLLLALALALAMRVVVAAGSVHCY